MKSKHGGAAVGAWLLGALALALGASAACGSEDATRQAMRGDPAGAGGNDDAAGGSSTVVPSGGTSSAGTGASGGGDASGGVAPTHGGDAAVIGAGAGGGEASAGAAGAVGTAGAAGAGGQDCGSVEPELLAGTWISNCNGYTCGASITATGDYGAGCTNGQFESGAIVDGKLDTTGEGGPYAPYSTKGTLTRTGCGTLQRDYIGQIPPYTGPEVSYSCELVRGPDCAPTLLQALEGVWDGNCGGNSQCTTTITAEGKISSTCSNGQSSTGSVEATGAFSDQGGGGGFADYSTTGVLALTSCDSFVMPYVWQSPPNQGKRTSAKCTYTRQIDM